MKRFPLLPAVLLFASAAFAADPAPAAPEYFDAARFDWHAVVPPPPVPGSTTAEAEREVALMLDHQRSAAQVALAKRYEKYDCFLFLTDVLGRPCTPEALPRTAAIMQQVWVECRPPVDAAKAAWNRPRPYIDNPALNPVVDKPNNASYPSGHAFGSSLLAVVLTAAFPEHAADWQQEAQLVRWSRLLGGAHYPSDVLAGRLLGEAVARELLRSPRMQAAIEEIRAELRAHRLKKAA